VIATNGNTHSAASEAMTSVTPLSAPTGLTATSSSPTTADLSWANAATGQTGFAIYRTTHGQDDRHQIDFVLANATSYQDTNLDEGTQYDYEVRAVNDIATSDSATASATTKSLGITSLSADEVDDAHVTLSWTNVSTTATSIRVERSDEGGAFNPIGTLTASDTTITDTNIVEGTHYAYQVVVVGPGGETVSSPLNVTPPPAAATALTTSSSTTTSIHLAWTDNSHAEDQFQIERSTDNVTFDPVTTVPADSNSYDDTVVVGTQYYYRVSAQEDSMSVPSASVAGIALADAPTISSATAMSDAEVDLSWTAGQGSAGFQIERKLGGGSYSVIATINDGTTLSYVDNTGLVESSSYTYRISGINASGIGPVSAESTARTLPTAAYSLSVNGTPQHDRIDLQWGVSSAADIHVYRSDNGGAFSDIATLAPSSTSYSDTSVTGGITYQYKLILNDGVNDSLPTDTVQATTPPEAVDNLNAVANSDTEVALTWSDSTGATSYKVSRSEDGISFDELETIGVNSYTDDSATEGTDYYYEVEAIGDGGTGPASVITVTTRPAAVTTVTVTSYTDTSVSLSWDDNDHSETGFKIERSTDGNSWDPITTTNPDETTYTDSTATEATTYIYRVTPMITAEAGGSATADVTTRPTAASAVSATCLTATSVNVTWSDNSDGESSYTVLRSDDGGTNWSPIATELDANTQSYEDDTVLPASTYMYKVTAVGVGGNSADSNADTVLTVTGAVADLEATATSTTTIDLAWSDVAGNDTYRLERQTAGNLSWDLIDNTITASATSFSDTTAVEGTTYTYRIFAVNATGDSAVSNTPSVTTVPADPSAMAASPTSATNIHVTWTDNSNGETGVELQRFDGTTWSTLANLDPDTESYDDTVAAGSTYSYRVRMGNDGGNSGFSGTASATTVPGQVTGVSAIAADDTTINVTWTGVSGATGYRVMRSDDAGQNFSQVGSDLAANAVSYSDTSATEATPYVYKVVAFNTTGAGADSTTSAATTFAAAPDTLAVTGITTTQVQLSWNDNSSGESEYLIYRSEDGTNFTQIDSVGPDGESYNDSDITSATTYSYYVTASNGAGESVASNTVTALTRTAAPTLTAATPTSDTTATITWSDVTGATAGYKLYRDDGNGYTLAASPSAGATSFNDSGLTEGTAYSYKLVAVNATGDSADSNVLSATTFPAAPDTLAVGTITATTVDLSWADNSNGETSFVIFRSDDNGDSWDIAGTNSANDNTFTDTGLTPGTHYLYHVTATDLGGSSDATSDAAALTLPAAPTSVDAQPTSDTSVHITWTAPAGIFNSYSLLRDNVEIAQPTSSDTSYDDTGLTEGTTYAYKLVAVNNTGNSADSNTSSATTNPATPDNVGVTGVATTSLNVTWTDESSAEDGYEVQRSTDGTNWTAVGSAAQDAQTEADSGLTEATHYYYRVRATMGSQTSAWSSSFQVDTNPDAPASLSVTSFTDTSVSLEWADSSNGEDGYVLQRSTDGGTNFNTVATLGIGVTTYTDTGRTESSDLVYKVHAYKGSSDSADSSTASVTTRPTAPSNLSASATDPTTVDLTWDDNSSTEDGFIIERSTDGGDNWSQIDTASADAGTYTDSAVPESSTVSYRVRAQKAGLESANSNESSATTPVAVPTAVVASATSDSAVHVTWSINSNVQTAQRLERSDDAGANWSKVADLDDSATSYDDSGLTEDSDYQYRVVALVNTAESDPSSAGSVTTPLTAPDSLVATSPTATSVSLTWTNHSSAATNIVIERNENGGGWSTLTTISSSLATYTDTTATEGLPYQYRIHATKAGNASATTMAADVTTIPSAPTSLSASAFSTTEIDLAWSDNSSHESGYEILRSEDNVNFTEVTTTAADANSYNDTGVHEGGTFYYLVQAIGDGGASATASASAITAPTAPSSFTVTPVTANRIDLAWADNSNGETGHTIERSTDGGTNWNPLTTVGAGVTTYSDTTVSEASSYNYRVRADRSTAHSSFATGNATTVPATPTSLASSVPAGSPRVTLTWTDNSAGENGYEIQRSTDGTNWSTVTTTAANAATYSDSSVVEGTTYQYRIRATSAAGNSDFSGTTTASTLPATPTSLVATAISGTRVDLTWTDNSTAEAGYKVERLPSGGSWTVIATIAANSASYSDTTASEGISYQYRVRAYTNAVQGNPSASASVSTPLSAPSNMTATAVSTTQVNLTWTDNSAAESNYKVERSTDNSTWTLITTVSANVTSCSDSLASAGTTYYYRVKATKSGLSSAYATASPVTTVPTAPSGASASAASDTQVNVSWTDASGETAYTVERSSDGGSNWTVLTTNVAANTTSYNDTTATENSTYLYRVKATNAAGASSYSTTSSVTTLPTGPSGLTANAVASDTVELTWTDNSSAETTFEIQREVAGSNSWSAIAVVGANTTSYTDPTLNESVTYDYRVRASVGGRNSAWSNTAEASALPNAPDSLDVTGTTDTTVSLQWNNTTDAPTIVIERSDDGGDNFTAIDTVGQGGTSYTDTGLTEGTTYVYRVRGYNGNGGFSDYTNTAIGVTVPAAPASFTADGSSGTQVVLNWLDQSSSEFGYVVERSVHGADDWAEMAALNPDSTSYVDINVTGGDDWDYRIRVYNEGGANYSAVERVQI
jgi:titin